MQDIVTTVKICYQTKLSRDDKSSAFFTSNQQMLMPPTPVNCVHCNEDARSHVFCVRQQLAGSRTKNTIYSICAKCFECTRKTLALAPKRESEPLYVRFDVRRINKIFLHRLLANGQFTENAHQWEIKGRIIGCSVCLRTMHTHFHRYLQSRTGNWDVFICESCMLHGNVLKFKTAWQYDATCALWNVYSASCTHGIPLPLDVIRLIREHWVNAVNFHDIAARQLCLAAQTLA